MWKDVRLLGNWPPPGFHTPRRRQHLLKRFKHLASVLAFWVFRVSARESMTTGLKDGIKSYPLTAVRGGVHVACHCSE